MNYTQIDHLIWDTLKMASEKEKDASNGIMDRYMMENGKAARNMEVVYGKIKMAYLM
mgnify:CR=1 FL=1